MTASTAIVPSTGQMILDVEELRHPDAVSGATIQEQFDEFHRLNPSVLANLETLTTDYLRRGRKRVGIGMLFEVLRWQHDLATRGDAFRLNNNYRSRYVRLMLARHPEWECAFHTRELVAA